MEYAKELLRAGELSVKQVCYACGFDDYSYFCHTFRRATGVTPGSLRAAKPT
jgi:AraC-like DNA-binding protein